MFLYNVHVKLRCMEIISKLVKMEANLPIDNQFIEAKLAEMGITPLRWAIVCVSRCEPVSACDEQDEQWEHKDGDVSVCKANSPREIGNKITLTISLACQNLC